jgi:hypothetical protein
LKNPQDISDKKISALHEILNWSASRPDWQKDALRRIVTKGTVEQADVDELAHLCRVKHGAEAAAKTELVSIPLDESHIPPSPGSESSVNLISVGNLKGVNRLAPNQVIAFDIAPGLTVIYGDNGSGKSGYARVIKKACRSRGTLPRILPNAFSDGNPGACEGSISFNVASKNHTASWSDGLACDSRLSNIFVFDSLTAETYLEQDGPASFTPHGLDVLPKLTKLCDLIGQELKIEISNINTEITTTAKVWKYNPETPVGKLIAGLSAKTAAHTVEELGGLDEKQKSRLKDLTDALKADPKQKAKETRASKVRLELFAKKIKEAAVNLSEAEIINFKKLFDDWKQATDVAKSFADGRFNEGDLPGTGNELWRALWEAARQFSTLSAYKDQQFPFTETGSQCLLCQQDLDDVTANKLKAFDEFCKDQTQKIADEASIRLQRARDKVKLMTCLADEQKKVDADMATATTSDVALITEFVTRTDAVLTTLKTTFSNGTWVDSAAIPISPAEKINVLCTTMEERAITEESADDPATRKNLEFERSGLADQEWLGSVKADILTQIERYKTIAKLEVCRKDVSSNGVTTKNSELTKLLVTDEFCRRFKSETDGLGLRTLNVKLQEIGGAKGEVRFGLRFEENSRFDVKEVASEGEQRCIALAAFLAELSQASHQSALVFDDPVSSLDHWHRVKIASRLVSESKTRQVVVFTHDAIFLNDLHSNAAEEGVTSKYYFLDWKDNQPGWCYEGLPWDCKSPEDRIDKLEKRQREIAQKWGARPSQESVADMREAYGWLRATIERTVEKIAFADVVFRFRSYVNLKNLDKVVGFAATECAEINRLFKKCCDVTEAHDRPQGKQATVPEPTDLLDDINATKQLLIDMRNRQKAIK